MESNATPPPLEVPAEPPMSLAGRLFNVFATPGDVFEEVKSQPDTVVNWLVPLIISCVVGIISTVLIFSQPNVARQIQEQQEKVFDKIIDTSKMSKQQADQLKAQMEKFTGPKFMMITGSIGVVLWTPAIMFLAGLVVWLLGTQLFKARFSYLKAVEAAGLASMISALGAIVRALLVTAKGNIVMAPSPVLFIPDFNLSSVTHALLSLLNVTSLWYVAVLSIALQKLSGTTFGKAAACVYGLWALSMVPMVTLSALMNRL